MTLMGPITAETLAPRDISFPAGSFHASWGGTARVAALVEGGVMIEQGSAPVFACVALSCLVQPEPGDIVLAACPDGFWVTAVLGRAGAAPLRLRAPGELVLEAGTRLTLSAATLEAQAGQARFALGEVSFIGRLVTAQLAALKLLGGVVETLAERVVQRARHSLRVTEQSDVQRSGTFDHVVTGTMNLQAEHAFITAGGAVRVDAEQIHMG
jgi:hypothetical protein